MFKKIYKILITSILFLSFIMSVNAGLCLPFLEQPPILNSVNSVYDENLNYLGQLSELNNTIQENWFVKVNMGSTTDFNNNINFERINILSDALYSSNWNYDEVDYTNLNTYIQTKTKSTNSFDFYQYLNGSSINGGMGQYFTEQFKFFSGGALQYAFHNLNTGFYDILLRATDDCGNTDYKFIPLEVKPIPNINSYVCNGVTTILTGGNVDVTLNNGCTDIISNNAGTISIFKGTIADNSEVNINFNSIQRDVNVFADNIFLSVINPIFNPQNYFNFNNHLNSKLNFKSAGNANTYITTSNMLNANIFSTGNLNIQIDNLVKGNISSNRMSLMGSYNNLNITLSSGNYIGGGVSAYTQTNNILNFIGTYTNSQYFGISYSSGLGFFENELYNSPTLTFTDLDQNKVALNKFQFGSGINPIATNLMMLMSDLTLSKQYNGVFVGNMWLDVNGNDIFTCSGNLIDFTNKGITYKVCDTPVLIGSAFGMMGTYNIFDYIIVTDTQAGGQQPTQASTPPTAILELSNYFPLINEYVDWNITKSFDTDGVINNTKLYIDNVLYENVNSSQFTNTFPATVGLTLEVTDNDGLKDTIYRTLNFKDTTSTCTGNSVPYGEIKKTNLGGDLWKFEVINQFDADNDTILSTVWTANYKEIQTDVLTTTVGYNQTVYVRLFDGCGSGTAFTSVGSSINVIPDKTTEPIVNLNCGLSSQTPISSLNCNLDYDLKGFPLNSIKWFYDGNELISQNNLTTFSFSVNDLNLHNVLVEVKSTQNVNSGSYNFKLVNNSIYINYSAIFGCTDNTATNYNPNATNDDGSCIFSNGGGNGNGNNNNNLGSGNIPYENIQIIDPNDTGTTANNSVGFFADLSNGLTSIGIVLAMFFFVLLLIGGIINLIS